MSTELATELEIAPLFNWLPVLAQNRHPYLFPEDRNTLSRQDYSRPGIYRWCLRSREGKLEFLVGETENFYTRIGQYLKHGNKHHIKIRERFDETLSSSGTVSLDLLEFQPFKIAEVTISSEKLHDPFVRLILENLCCLLLLQQGFALVNAAVKKKQKGELFAIARQRPEEFNRAIEEVLLQKKANAS